MGLHCAGFDLVGVDINPQPNYPFEFRHGDALDADLSGFDFVWASPVCKRYSSIARRVSDKHPDQVGAVREKLVAWGGEWVIENVVGAPLRRDLMLCGTMFGLPLRRHRIFEMSFAPPVLVQPCHHWGKVGERGDGTGYRGAFVGVYGNTNQWRGTVDEWRKGMGIDWMSGPELSQAIPPSYSEFIGLHALRSGRAA